MGAGLVLKISLQISCVRQEFGMNLNFEAQETGKMEKTRRGGSTKRNRLFETPTSLPRRCQGNSYMSATERRGLCWRQV